MSSKEETNSESQSTHSQSNLLSHPEEQSSEPPLKSEDIPETLNLVRPEEQTSLNPLRSEDISETPTLVHPEEQSLEHPLRKEDISETPTLSHPEEESLEHPLRNGDTSEALTPEEESKMSHLTAAPSESNVELLTKDLGSKEIPPEPSHELSSPNIVVTGSNSLAGGDSSSISTQNDKEPDLKNESLKTTLQENEEVHKIDSIPSIQEEHFQNDKIAEEPSNSSPENIIIPNAAEQPDIIKNEKPSGKDSLSNELIVNSLEETITSENNYEQSSHQNILPPNSSLDDEKDEDFSSMPTLESTKSQPKESPKSFNLETSPRQTDEDGWLDLTGSGGLKKKVIRTGRGYETRPHKNDIVTISYQCFDINNELVDEKADLEVIIGDWDVIPGVDMALALMEEDEECQLLVPARFAYMDKERGEEHSEEPLFHFKLHLKKVEKESDENFISIERRHHFLKAKRERGNKWYTENYYSLALNCYERILAFIQRVTKKGSDQDLNEEEKEFSEAMDSLRIVMLNNKAACQLKLNLWDHCLNSLDEVLDKDPKNSKALFRKAKVLANLGKYEKAIDVLKTAAVVEPNEKVFSKALNEVVAKKKKQEAAEKEMYKRMFKNTTSSKKDQEPKGVNIKWGIFTVATIFAAVACSAYFYRHFSNHGPLN